MARTGFRKGAKIGRFEKALTNPSGALRSIGAMMVAESQLAFKRQQFGRDRWPGRGVPNVMGIIADFAAGKDAPPNRRFQSSPALVDTGRLKGSISFEVSSNTVSVGSNLPYAKTLHSGGEVESEPITSDMQTRMAEWLRGESRERQKKLGWMLNPQLAGSTVTTKVPARPFVGITKETVEDIHEILGVEIFEVR